MVKYIIQKMDMNIGIIGKMINKWDKEEKNGVEVLHMKVIMKMEINKNMKEKYYYLVNAV